MNEFKKSRSRYKMTFTANKLPMALAIFCSGRICERQSCPIFAEQNGVLNCHIFVRDNPDKAAELMGLEVVETEDKPRLTEQELAICKEIGAKWVSRDLNAHDEDYICLWKERPNCSALYAGRKKVNTYYFNHDTEKLISKTIPALFPSIFPGDCVNVEELMNDE